MNSVPSTRKRILILDVPVRVICFFAIFSISDLLDAQASKSLNTSLFYTSEADDNDTNTVTQ